jgi:hypothetical protein
MAIELREQPQSARPELDAATLGIRSNHPD